MRKVLEPDVQAFLRIRLRVLGNREGQMRINGESTVVHEGQSVKVKYN